MDYQKIYKHYESCLDKYGDTSKGVDWPNEKDAQVRYSVMSDGFKNKEAESIIDLGCGAGHYYTYLKSTGILNELSYTGIDISSKFIELCETKFPEANWMSLDILKDELSLQADFVVMNGVFTEKVSLSFDEMLEFWKNMLRSSFKLAKIGLAFNVMSSQVDWERDDLFHLPLDTMADFVHKNLTRHFSIRRDYGLYEYTVYLYKEQA